jgi:hypothetical protein
MDFGIFLDFALRPLCSHRRRVLNRDPRQTVTESRRLAPPRGRIPELKTPD